MLLQVTRTVTTGVCSVKQTLFYIKTIPVLETVCFLYATIDMSVLCEKCVKKFDCVFTNGICILECY